MRLPFALQRPTSEIPVSTATDIDINPIAGTDASNVQDALEALFGGSSSANNNPMTLEAYNAIAAKENRLYFIADSEGVLVYIYYKDTLIAKRGETSSMSSFPLVFPYVFN